MQFTDNEISYLKNVYAELPKDPYTRGYEGKPNYLGEIVRSFRHPELHNWLLNYFNIDPEVETYGLISTVFKPLSLHADAPKFGKRFYSIYTVLETDATEEMSTFVFDQTVDYRTWINMDESAHTLTGFSDIPLKDRDYFKYLTHVDEKYANLGFSLKEKLPLQIGNIIQWESFRIHSGQSFTSTGASYKMQLLVVTTKEPQIC